MDDLQSGLIDLTEVRLRELADMDDNPVSRSARRRLDEQAGRESSLSAFDAAL